MVTAQVNCAYSSWSDWTQCDAKNHCQAGKTDATGESIRTRQITTPSANGGQECNADLREYQACQYTACPVCQVKGRQWAGIGEQTPYSCFNCFRSSHVQV